MAGKRNTPVGVAQSRKSFKDCLLALAISLAKKFFKSKSF